MMRGKPPSIPTNGSLRRLRIITGAVLVVLIAFMLVAEAFAGVFGINSEYSAQPLVVGTLLGGLLLVIGIEIGSRWPLIGGGQNQYPPPYQPPYTPYDDVVIEPEQEEGLDGRG